METRAHYVAVGAFVLAVIVIGFVAVLSLGRVEFAQDLKRYYIFFKGSVTGLSKGSAVQYNGRSTPSFTRHAQPSSDQNSRRS